LKAIEDIQKKITVVAPSAAPGSTDSLELPKFVNQARRSESFVAFIARTYRELAKVKFALASFVVNSIRKRYHRSVLGFAWSMLNPLLTMGVMTLVFSVLFHLPLKQFALQLFSGLMPWMFISESWTMGSTSILVAEPFLKKVYLPKAFFPLVSSLQALSNFIFSMASLMVIALLMGMQVGPAMLALPLAIGVLFLFNFAMCLVLSVLTVYLRDLTHVVGVALGLAFYSVPIIYPITQVPLKYHIFIKLNPFYYFLDLFRSIICRNEFPPAYEWGITFGISIFTVVVGLLLLKSKENDIIYRL